jgi:nickel transport protein
MSKIRVYFFAMLILALAPAAKAHEFWVEQKGGEFTLVYGHGSNREEFDASKVKGITTLDAAGKAIEVQKEKKGKGLLLKLPAAPAVIFVEIDNGYWSKTIYGWKELPKRKASRVVEAIRSYNYSKALFAWGSSAQKLPGDPKLDIIPMRNPFDLKSGDSLQIRVVCQGKPVPDAEVEGTDHQKVATTDKDGFTQLPLSKGYQVITVTHKVPLKDDPDADFLSMTMTLTFEVKR